MAKKIDMTGWVMKEHNVPDSKLTVIEEDFDYKKTHNIQAKYIKYWKCKCECGKIFTACGVNIRNGNTKSCGCLQKDKISKINAVNLCNQRFGKLLVIEKAFSKNKRQYWKCKCDCGNEIYLNSSAIPIQKQCQVCAQLQRADKRRIDLTGKQVGYLKVLSINLEKTIVSNHGTIWNCQCKCGNIITVPTGRLSGKHRLTMSCGCIKSHGEQKIMELLLNNNIPFEKQKTFLNCYSEHNRPFYYDFYINNQFLLEFDGIQHFQTRTGGWNNENNLKLTQERDKIKNEYAKSHNIPLKRIPYWDYDKITLENIMSDKWLVNN